MADRGYAMGSSRYRSIRNPGKPLNGGLVKFGEERYERALSMALSIPGRVRAGCFEAVASWKGGWVPWDPKPEIRRNGAQLNGEHRFGDFGDDPEDDSVSGGADTDG